MILINLMSFALAMIRNHIKKGLGEPGGNRTHDPKIKSLVLYQLSYRLAT